MQAACLGASRSPCRRDPPSLLFRGRGTGGYWGPGGNEANVSVRSGKQEGAGFIFRTQLWRGSIQQIFWRRPIAAL